MGANSFLYEMTPINMGGNNENDRVASPESVPSRLIFRLADNLGKWTFFGGKLSFYAEFILILIWLN